MLDELLPLVKGAPPSRKPPAEPPTPKQTTVEVSAKTELDSETKASENKSTLDNEWLIGTNVEVTEKVWLKLT